MNRKTRQKEDGMYGVIENTGRYIRPRARVKIDKLSVFLLCLIFISNDTFLFGTNINATIVAIPRYMMVVFCVAGIIYVLRHAERRIVGGQLIMYMLMLMTFVVACYFNQESISRVVIKILCMTSALLITLIVPFQRFTHAYNRVLYFLAWFSLVIEVLAYLTPALVRIMPVVTNSSGFQIRSLIFAGVFEHKLGMQVIRSTGIFWEPGVYQIYLNIAICFELFVATRINRKHLTVYLLALAITFSTTGYIACIWILACYFLFFRGKTVQSRFKSVLAFVVLLLIIAGLLMLFDSSILTQTVFGKLFDEQNGSTNVRLASVVINLEILHDHPLFGIGMGRMEEEFLIRTKASDLIYGFTHQNTNTTLYQFAAHGMLFGLLFLFGTLQFGRGITKMKVTSLGIFIMFILMYTGENLMISILPYLVIFYGYGHKAHKRYSLAENGLTNSSNA